MATAFGDLVVRFSADTSGLRRGAGMANSAIYTLRRSALSLASVLGFTSAGAGMYMMGRLAEEFNRKMRNSLAIMGDVSAEMTGALRKTALDVAATTMFTPGQAAEGYYELVSAGMNAQQALAAMPQVAAFAQAGMVDLATATKLASTAQSAIGLKSDDAQQNLINLTRVTDVLTKANIVAIGTTREFAVALTEKAAAAARVSGKDLEETVAVLATFAMQGTLGEEAGTRLQMVLRDMRTKAITNADAFNKYNVSVYNSSGSMRHMADIIADLERALFGASDAFETAALNEMGFTDRSIAGLQQLLGMSNTIRDFDSTLRIAGGTTQEVADKQLTDMQRALSVLRVIMTELGGVLLNRIYPVLRVLRPYIHAMADDLYKVGGAAESANNDLEILRMTLDAIFDGFRYFHIGIKGIGSAITWDMAKAASYISYMLDMVGMGSDQMREFAITLRKESEANWHAVEALANKPLPSERANYYATHSGLPTLATDAANAANAMGGLNTNVKTLADIGIDATKSAENIQFLLDSVTEKGRELRGLVEKWPSWGAELDRLRSTPVLPQDMARRNAAIEMFEKLARAIEKVTNHMEDMKSAKSAFEDTLSPLEQYVKKMQDLARLNKVGAFNDPRHFMRAQQAAGDSLLSAMGFDMGDKRSPAKRYEEAVAMYNEFRRKIEDTLESEVGKTMTSWEVLKLLQGLPDIPAPPVTRTTGKYQLAEGAERGTTAAASLIAKNWAQMNNRNGNPNKETAKNTSKISRSVDDLVKLYHEMLKEQKNAEVLGVPG